MKKESERKKKKKKKRKPMEWLSHRIKRLDEDETQENT